ncbi:conserved hypothetical protein [Alteracholeplasma palmae J233]|uniref:Uncharacterized protein n=1 Tax=Alteracholeplasma palmae (strain ATCC 49389 / J233) TaxID=1318466 RepID=U4KPK7_ALTPJ|nr:SbcC/MukB-like Walker B domain-containing protein [Alteracholeplasma palmae]CCV64190.1 conserved hypothetical protein [Alteracholeplasma palmae J233]
MKKLTKIKLVNWHLFTNQTIEIKDNTLISGENGSGKSTLLDALQYLLVGGKSGVKFNIAATDEARRSLEGYIRGRIGAENKEYLRNNDVVTHVALEFYDEQSNESGIIGCVLELPKGGQLKERFYLLENTAIHENIFIENRFPRDYKSMKAYFKDLEIDFKPFDSQKHYRDAVARYFGLDAKKYARILPKALAFRPIDLQAFVFEFLLDDDPIDIQSLKNNVEQLKKVENQIRIDREKLDKLSKIIDLGSQLNLNLDQIEINQLIEKLSFIEKRETFLENSKDTLDQLNQKYEILKSEKEQLDELIETNDKEIVSLETARNNNDVSRSLANYKDALVKKGELYEQQKEIVMNLRNTVSNEVQLMKKFSETQSNPSIQAFVKYYLANEENLNVMQLQEHLSSVSKEVAGYINAYHLEQAKLEEERNEISDQISIVSLRLNQLKRNIKTYPRHVTELIEIINEELTNQYQKEVRVRPFCELIEVNEPLWRNALEGYLGGQRFDLIVDPAYFNDALEIYDRVKFERKIYGVGLVNTQKLQDYKTADDNSLASKLTTNHPYARLYANMLLSGVRCVENVQDLKKYHRAITPSCMTYGNYTARQINPRVYEVPYIGQEATDLQVRLDSEELEMLEKQIHSLYDLLEKTQMTLRILNNSKALQIVNQNQLRYFDIVKQTRKEYTLIEEQIAKLSYDADIAKLEEELESLKQTKRQYRLDFERLIGLMSDSRKERTDILEQIDISKAELENLYSEQRKLNEENTTKLNAAHAQFNAYKQKYDQNFDHIIRALNQSTISIQNQNARQEGDVVNLMRQYITNYHFGAAPDISELIEFEKEASLIRDNNLVHYEQEAIELRRNSEIGFKEEFVNKLRASIENAQQQISELNMALTGKTFGADSYKLTTRASDNPEYKQYYGIIMDNDAIETNSLFTESLTKRNEIILMELFEKIASTDPEFDKLSYNFLDYRNYMSYDIEVTNANGNISYFSKVSKEKSGGETQVPFYIVIAASFQQLLTRNKRMDSGCIVLFDEAFNNMDESRIDAMMKFYNSLSIQLFIAVPPQRVSNIVSYVNTSLAIVKDNDYAVIETFKDERVNR